MNPIMETIYIKSGGTIKNPKMLAYFLKRNVYIDDFTAELKLLGLISWKTISVRGALYSECIDTLMEKLDLTHEEATAALELLQLYGLVKIRRFWLRGRFDGLVEFLV